MKKYYLERSLNIVLGILYIPLSVFSWLMQMASENTIGAENLLYVNLIDVFCVMSFLIPVVCLVGIFLSAVFRKKGQWVLAIVFQFIPLVVFLLNLLLLYVAESMPH